MSVPFVNVGSLASGQFELAGQVISPVVAVTINVPVSPFEAVIDNVSDPAPIFQVALYPSLITQVGDPVSVTKAFGSVNQVVPPDTPSATK